MASTIYSYDSSLYSYISSIYVKKETNVYTKK